VSSTGGGVNNNPIPTIGSISPNGAAEFGSSLTLTVKGSGFIDTSQVEWNGSSLTTTYQSATSLQAQVPASDLTTTGASTVTVVNPSPGGGSSAAATFTVGNPLPVLSSISPSSASSGSAAFTLTATGSNFVRSSVIQWNGTALTTAYVTTTQLTAQIPATDLTGGNATTTANVSVMTPAPNGGASSVEQFSILAPATNLKTANIQANHIIWDPTHKRIYASVYSLGTTGNSVVAIDPVTASVGTPQAAGNQPNPLALSSDDSFLYVGLDFSGQIKRFALPGLVPDTSLNLTLPVDQFFGQEAALALAVAPGKPHTFAAILGNIANRANTTGTVLFDDATPRPNTIQYTAADDSTLAWGADATLLYANDGFTSGNDLFILSADSNGLTLKSDYGDMVPTYYGNIYFDSITGYIYSDDGRVVNPATASVVGTFNISAFPGPTTSLCALDAQNGRAFFVGQTTDQLNGGAGVTIEEFDTKTYKLLNTLSVPQTTGHPIDFVRWGNSGLALHTSTSGTSQAESPGPVYILDGNFVNPSEPADSAGGTPLAAIPTLTSISPQSTEAGSGDTNLTVTGANFSSDSTVMWNGAALQTTVSSGTQLQATIPLADLSAAGSAIVSIADTNSGLSAASSLVFTILPPPAGTTILSAWNYASLDLAWDAIDSKLILPVWSADPVYPNTVLEIDPATGSVTKSTSVTTDPDLVRVTDDDKNLYVGYSLANKVDELALPGLGAETSWSLGYDSFLGPLYAWDLEPAPGEPQTTAVAFGAYVAPPETNGLTVFDSGVARPMNVQLSPGYQNIEWNQAATTIYATDGDIGLDTYSVAASEVSLQMQKALFNVPQGLGNIHFDAGTGDLYADSGVVLNPSTYAIVGTFNASGMLLLDSTLNRVFILGQLTGQASTNSYTIQSFNESNFTLVDQLTLNSLVGVPVAFVRWGTNGLALVTSNKNVTDTKVPPGMLYIISDTDFVIANSAVGTKNPGAELVHAFPTRLDAHRAVSDDGTSRVGSSNSY
jgi:hypothetical protein